MLRQKTLDSHNHKNGSLVFMLDESVSGLKEYTVYLYGHKENFTFDCLSYEHGEKLFKMLYWSLTGQYRADDGSFLRRDDLNEIIYFPSNN